ncbi:DNA-binding protein [Budvicia diplopodorum]|uniref:DNA-binding protein n=1 Tax=Budvicia diplopodorum TaxID=1119056 RepID=UPI00135C2290|nr:DNA-binding protein [Budvicia diplopodorum]
MKKEWFSTNELTGIAGLPSTIQGINQKARREQWNSRKRLGIQGKALEYHIDSIPDKARSVLRANENGTQYIANSNDPFSIWVTAYNQLTLTEREQITSLIVRYGVTGLMAKVNARTESNVTVPEAELSEVE